MHFIAREMHIFFARDNWMLPLLPLAGLLFDDFCDGIRKPCESFRSTMEVRFAIPLGVELVDEAVLVLLGRLLWGFPDLEVVDILLWAVILI